MILSETSMNRMLSLGEEYGYLCITSDRQLPKKEEGYSKNERDSQKHINNVNREKLEQEIKELGLSFVKVIGGYPEEGNESEMIEEQTFFVLNFDIRTKEPLDMDEFIEIGVSLAYEWNQDSVLIYDIRNSKPTYFDKYGNLLSTFNGKVINDMESVYYTCFQKSKKGRDSARDNGKDWRFTYIESNKKIDFSILENIDKKSKRLLPITMTYSDDNTWTISSSEEGYGRYAIKTTPERMRKALLRMKFKNQDNHANSKRTVKYMDIIDDLMTKGNSTCYCWKSFYPKTREDFERLTND